MQYLQQTTKKDSQMHSKTLWINQNSILKYVHINHRRQKIKTKKQKNRENSKMKLQIYTPTCQLLHEM